MFGAEEEAGRFVEGSPGEDGDVAGVPGEVVVGGFDGLAGEAVILLGDGKRPEDGGAEVVGPFAVEGVIEGEEHGNDFFKEDGCGGTGDEVGGGATEAGEAYGEGVGGVEGGKGNGVRVVKAGETEDVPGGLVGNGRAKEGKEIGSGLGIIFGNEGVGMCGLEEEIETFDVAKVAANGGEVGGLAMEEAISGVGVLGDGKGELATDDGRDAGEGDGCGGKEGGDEVPAIGLAIHVDDVGVHEERSPRRDEGREVEREDMRIGLRGFEPPTSCAQGTRSNQAELQPAGMERGIL